MARHSIPGLRIWFLGGKFQIESEFQVQNKKIRRPEGKKRRAIEEGSAFPCLQHYRSNLHTRQFNAR